jgi:hypothetical protein
LGRRVSAFVSVVLAMVLLAGRVAVVENTRGNNRDNVLSGTSRHDTIYGRLGGAEEVWSHAMRRHEATGFWG